MSRIVIATLMLLAMTAASSQTTAGAEAIVDRDVAFRVVNMNESRVPCDTDGKAYTLHGTLIAPASSLRGRPSVTLYIHGAMFSGQHLWRLRPGGDSSFDYGLAMARRGHASIVIDLLGYGSSVSAQGPDGNLVCQGSQADMIHQVIRHLRDGAYTYGSKASGPAFGRVALAGLSYGAQFSQPAAYSFGDIDALVVMGYAEPPVSSDEVNLTLATWIPKCAPPGQAKYTDGTGPTGYQAMNTDLAMPTFFNDGDSVVETELSKLAESDPCGQASSFPARFATDAQHLGEITVPVLLAFGASDEWFGQPGPQIHLQRFTGSSDRTLMLFPGAGHVFFLEKHRALWIEMIAGWLGGHGF